MKNVLKDLKVAVIGGGPGGLTLARLLQIAKVNVVVYERDKDKSVRQQGATLDLHEGSGLRALEKGGLMDEFKKLYRPGADKMRITDKNATILMDDHLNASEENFGDESFRPEIDRGPLRDMLIDSLNEGTIKWNSQFRELKKQGNGWNIVLTNGQTDYADIVIAADGANSKLRKYITDIEPIYSGITIVEGNVYNAAKNAPKLWDLVNGGKVMSFEDEKTVILSAKGEGSLSFYTGTKEKEDWAKESGIDFTDRQQLLNWFKQRYPGWSEVWYELFASDDSYFIPRPQYHYQPGQSWQTLPNITMIGDAAHRMPPYAGEGVNMAMQDALELYEALCEMNFENVRDAFAFFETKMLQRASEITRDTLENTERMHSDGSLELMLGFFGGDQYLS
ncbi:MAG: NAD(P)/FAD-dependent oxidoreductase [Bacteroidota bacterium]